MLVPEDVEEMQDLHRAGWSIRKIASKLDVSRNTVSKYLKQGEWKPYGSPSRPSALDGLGEWLRHSFLTHNGNAEVVRQELVAQHGIEVSLRTVERAVAQFRKKLRASKRFTVRFETPPGRQLQIDFGSKVVEIGGVKSKVFLFVATLGYSRRIFVAPFRHERQSAWFRGMESAFRHFNGMTEQVVIDNPKALVQHHNPLTREVVFNERFAAFAHYWNFRPKPCQPYRPQTKGKDESAVKYVKRNALAGRSFTSWEHLEEDLAYWMREVADVRIHGTCKERPIDRFSKERLKPLNGRPPFESVRELRRTVHSDSCVEVDGNFYSVPWRHIGSILTVQVADRQIIIFDKEEEVARHTESSGHRERTVDNHHLSGVIRLHQPIEKVVQATGFERPLEVYQQFAGGSW